MVAPAPFLSSSPAGQGRSASQIAFDHRGATQVSPENVVSEQFAHRFGRARSHRRDAHPGRRRFSGQTRVGRYCRARYYHPSLQRFISEDPIGSPDTSHVLNKEMQCSAFRPRPKVLPSISLTFTPMSGIIRLALEIRRVCSQAALPKHYASG